MEINKSYLLQKPLKRITIEEVGSEEEERSHGPEGEGPRLIEQLPEKRINATDTLLMTAADKRVTETRNSKEKATTYVFNSCHRIFLVSCSRVKGDQAATLFSRYRYTLIRYKVITVQERLRCCSTQFPIDRKN